MKVSNLNLTLGRKPVLNDVSFEIYVGDKVALIGANGAGKSSLLKVLAGRLKARSGEVKINGTVDYLEQEIEKQCYKLSILQYLKFKSGILKLETQMQKLEQDLTDDKLDEYNEVLETFLSLDGYNFDSNATIIKNGLGLKHGLDTPVGQLSGGEKIKVSLASVLLGAGDYLLLDEPTNNLDIESVEYLEKFLAKSKKTMIIVSHDENFLSSVSNKTMELKNGEVKVFPFNYSTYVDVQNSEYERDFNQYIQTQSRRDELKDKLSALQSANRSSKSNSKSRDNDKIGRDYKIGRGQNKSGAKIRSLERELQNTTLDPNFRERVEYEFIINEDVEDKITRDIYVKDLECGCGEFKTHKLNFQLPFGERLMVVGGNGSGKTTFIKTLMGKIPAVSGQVIVNRGVKFGYIEQNTLEEDTDLSMYEYITQGIENVDKAFVFQVLKNFGVNYEDAEKKFGDFSSGERTKINLAKLSLENINVLVLDEPTNHLDIDSSKVLYGAIQRFQGTIIAVSHNKTFIERLKPTLILNMETGEVHNSNFFFNNEEQSL